MIIWLYRASNTIEVRFFQQRRDFQIFEKKEVIEPSKIFHYDAWPSLLAECLQSTDRIMYSPVESFYKVLRIWNRKLIWSFDVTFVSTNGDPIFHTKIGASAFHEKVKWYDHGHFFSNFACLNSQKDISFLMWKGVSPIFPVCNIWLLNYLWKLEDGI